MKRSTHLLAIIVLLLTGLAASLHSPQHADAQSSCQTFTETGKTVCGRFLEYWRKNGGLAQRGLPLTGEFVEISDLNGLPYVVQYFERAVFEKHPENPPPHDVLLSQLGTFRYNAKYPSGPPSGGPPPGGSPPPASDPFSTPYSNATFGIAATLPGGNWTLRFPLNAQGSEGEFIGTIPPRLLFGYSRFTYGVARSTEELGEITKGLLSGTSTYPPQEQAVVQYQGTTAIRLTTNVRYGGNTPDYRHVWIIFTLNNRTHAVTAAATVDYWPLGGERDVAAMLDSFHFTGASSSNFVRLAAPSPQTNCRAFPETGKRVCGRFLEYWQKNGGLAQQGLPLSEEFTEVSDLNGQTYTVQYFERAVFERHPENPAPHDVLLSQLGTFRFQAKYPGGDPAPPPLPQPPTPIQPTAVPSGPYAASANVSNATPDQRENVTLTTRLTRGGQPVQGATMNSVWHY